MDDFVQDSQNNAQEWYRSVLDTALGNLNFSVWEIGKELPYSNTDLSGNLGDYVVGLKSSYTTKTKNPPPPEPKSLPPKAPLFIALEYISFKKLLVIFLFEAHFSSHPRRSSSPIFSIEKLFSNWFTLGPVVKKSDRNVLVTSFMSSGNMLCLQ